MRGFLAYILDSILPATCLLCGKGLTCEDALIPTDFSLPAAGSFEEIGCTFEVGCGFRLAARVICAACWAKFEPARVPGRMDSLGDIPVIAPFYTNDALLAVVRFLKFSGGRSAAVPLGRCMTHALVTQIEGNRKQILGRSMLVPVPLHRHRYRERGYNQAELLSREVGRLLGLSVGTDILVRIRDTKCQSKLPRDERESNVRGAFEICRSSAARCANVIIVDDLVTTGETVRACIEVLKACRPASIVVLAGGRVRESSLTD